MFTPIQAALTTALSPLWVSLVAADPRTISVTGEAEVKVVPNEVVLSIGVEVSDRELRAAREESERRVEKIVSVTREHGVAPGDVSTDYLNVEPRYQDGYAQSDFLGYWVRRALVINLRDISRFESLLEGVLTAGANYVHGVEFRTTALRTHRDEARALAIRAAREKAQALAAELGQRIGRPTAIEEHGTQWWSGYGAWWGGRFGSAAMQNVSQSIGGESLSSSSTLTPGQISVTARVGVTFELVEPD